MGGPRVRGEITRENHDEGAFKCPLGVEPPRVTIPGEGPLLVTLGCGLKGPKLEIPSILAFLGIYSKHALLIPSFIISVFLH